MSIAVKVRTETSAFVLNGLQNETTCLELCNLISEKSGIDPNAQLLRVGYPPKAVQLENFQDPISSLPLRNNDVLIVSKSNTQSNSNFASSNALQRHIIPSDNSCLFRAISFSFNNGSEELMSPTQLREIVVQAVKGNPEKYSTDFLGANPVDYCNMISKPDSWGGAIEIAILSDFLAVEICAVDIQSNRIDRYGETHFYQYRMLLLYDGVHYDSLFKGPGVTSVFPTSEDFVLNAALQLASELRTKHQYTDVANFSLQCKICNKKLRGQKEAQEHATLTSHSNFAEVSV